MKRFDVLTIGLQVIDLMIPGMDGHILDREMTLLDHAELTLGGDALNQAIVLSQLGARTALMGAAGVDRLAGRRAAAAALALSPVSYTHLTLPTIRLV